MKIRVMKSIQFFLCLLFLIATSSCQPVTEIQPEPIISPSPTPTQLSTENPIPPTSNLDHLTQLAIADLAQRLELEPNLVNGIETQPVIWSDYSLGCPQPGVMYAQVRVAGYLIELEANGEIYKYHTDANRQVIFCEENDIKPVQKSGDIKDDKPWMPVEPIEPNAEMPRP